MKTNNFGVHIFPYPNMIGCKKNFWITDDYGNMRIASVDNLLIYFRQDTQI